ncbi:MAG: hypothetical protein HY925_05485 [Elusimicrobia bacterium]|nr:hypothetical protein [Elusimicrobiota bacterium]
MKLKKSNQEVGDLFVTDTAIMVKLLPSRKVGTKPIRWFNNGTVTNARSAAKDISALIGKVRRKSSVVRGLTVMTDRGLRFDLSESGLPEAVEKAGFDVLN